MTARELSQIQSVVLRHRPKTPEEAEDLIQRYLGLSVCIRVERDTGCWVPVKEAK